LRAFEKSAPLLIKKHEHMLLLMRIIELFPGLVLPIELREQASKIASALNDKRSAIREMLVELGRISGALDPRSYARGLVISNCESSLEIDLAVNLIEQTLKSRTFPVVPLFESRKALIGSKKILKTWFLKKGNLEFVRRHWSSKFELMLGYTDTAKQNGALASRYLVSRAMADVGRVLMSHRIAPIFFHGSGGNVERGGGSLKEQISWWPTSAVETPKLTIQGEMIQRLFSTKEILHSHCVQLTNEILRRKVRRSRLTRNPELERFVELARASYSTLVSNPSRIARLINGTPYHYLDVLQTDSRLKKRTSSDGASPESLRTIPWVLSWTQSRILLPNWWGVGTAWESSDLEARDKLKIILKENSFFSSFVKSLGFTLAKVDLEIWELYFDAKADKDLIEMCRRELALAHKFFHEITDQQELIWYRPWLEESIRLRSPHIHLLNLLQILALKSDDEALLKETIVGIGCGMLTTS
jgi:phosphoenolpyruvate carboxylase